MFRNRIVISSLHEDLMNIGLLPKSNQKFLNEMIDEEEDDNELNPHDPNADNDDADMDSDHSDDMPEGDDEAPEGSDDDASENPDENMDDMDDHSQFDDDQENGDMDHVAENPSAPFKKPEAKLPTFSHQMPESRNSTSARVGKLLENVNSLVNGVHAVKRKDALKSFANVSMISEMLSRGFTKLARTLAENDLRDVATTYRNLSENSGKIALALKADKNVSKLDERFKGQMNVLLQGLDLYEDILEACEEMSEEHSEDCDCDDCDAKHSEYAKDDDDMGGESDEDSSEDDDPKAGGDVHVDIIKNGSHDFGKKKKTNEADLY